MQMTTLERTHRVATALCRESKTLAIAESCTGGLLGAACTQLDGSSRWFIGGIIAYANSVKEIQLGVPSDWIADQGAVSEAVACAMADGVRHHLSSTFGIGITGIAGPDGGTAEKPVGLVWIAVASPTGIAAFPHHLHGDRQGIRQSAVDCALDHLLSALDA